MASEHALDDGHPRVSARVLLPVMFLVLISVRIYHEWLMRSGQRWWTWFELHPWAILALAALAVVSSYAAAVVMCRRFTPRMAIPAAVAAGAITTAAGNSLLGAAIGAVIGASVVSRRLRCIESTVVIQTLWRIVPCVVLYTCAGFFATGSYYAEAGPQRSAGLVLAVACAIAGLWIGTRGVPLPPFGQQVRPKSRLSLLGWLVVAAILAGPALHVGWRADTWYRWWQLSLVGSVGITPAPGLLTGYHQIHAV